MISLSCPFLLAIIAAGEPPPQSPAGALTPGLTLWVYDLGDPLTQSRRPTIAEGQTPNLYAVHPTLDLSGPFPTQFGPLTESFTGDAHGWLNIEQPGDYTFRLTCDDGAALIIDGITLTDTDAPPSENFVATAGLHLDRGLHALSIPFYQRGGEFRLHLEWRTPNAPAGPASFTTIPESALRTEAGQTFAVSPGPKRWFYGRDPNRPGDGRPLESVHPSFTLENFRGPDFQPAVGGLAFLPPPDNRLAVCTWDHTGAVYLLDHLDQPEVTVSRFASGLGEPLGIAVSNNDLYITQKREVTRLRDLDGDGVADEYLAVAHGWPASHNYHEFSFNLVPLDDHFFITTSVPLKTGLTNYTPGTAPAFAVGESNNSGGPGCCLRIDPTTGSWIVHSRGLRAPNGMGLGPDGDLYCCDNQGAWLPASRLNRLREGGFFGHQTEPDGTVVSDPPVCWFPHGEIGNSPTEPILIPDGPYRRQLLIGDVTHGGLNRAFIEHPTDEPAIAQGCVFQFSQGLEAGVNRLAWGPDGCLYVGGIGANGNWNHKNKKFGLQRLRPSGHTPFEPLKVESRAAGFLITFTQPVPESILTDPANYLIQSWRYRPTIDYGGPKIDLTTLAIQRIIPSPDRRAAYLELSPLSPDTLLYFRLRNFKSDSGEDPFVTEAWYTLNTISSRSGPGFDLSPAKPVPYPTRPATATTLYDGSPASLDLWQHTDGKPCRWRTTPAGELLAPQSSPFNSGADIVTLAPHGDCYLHLEWLSPPGGSLAEQTNGNSGVKLQSRYEVQIMNSPAAPHAPKFNEAGSIYRQRAPDSNASHGAGVWQTYDLRFRAPRWSGDRKIEPARLTLWWNGLLVHDNVELPDKTGASLPEAPGDHPLLLQAHPSSAIAPVRFRNIWMIPE